MRILKITIAIAFLLALAGCSMARYKETYHRTPEQQKRTFRVTYHNRTYLVTPVEAEQPNATEQDH